MQFIVNQVNNTFFAVIVNNSMRKKLRKNLSVSKMAVPLHRFSPQVWR